MQSGGGALAGLVGRCPAIESMRREVRQFGASDVRVHVFGETGTGKERVARALHELSPRASRRFVPVNAAGIGDDLLMPELFGHARGAFTGAVAARDGYVAEAEGGTLFLDEVAELSPLAQARLLRFLQEGEYRRLGETVLRKADVRLVSATNVDLAERVRLGRFRHDLWFRLKTERLVVPPLRAVWIPVGVEHQVLTMGRVAMRSVNVASRAARRLPHDCCVVGVPPLLRELILRVRPSIKKTPGADGRSERRSMGDGRGPLPALRVTMPYVLLTRHFLSSCDEIMAQAGIS